MVPQSMTELEDHRKFLENRARLPLDELARRWPLDRMEPRRGPHCGRGGRPGGPRPARP